MNSRKKNNSLELEYSDPLGNLRLPLRILQLVMRNCQVKLRRCDEQRGVNYPNNIRSAAGTETLNNMTIKKEVEDIDTTVNSNSYRMELSDTKPKVTSLTTNNLLNYSDSKCATMKPCFVKLVRCDVTLEPVAQQESVNVEQTSLNARYISLVRSDSFTQDQKNDSNAQKIESAIKVEPKFTCYSKEFVSLQLWGTRHRLVESKSNTASTQRKQIIPCDLCGKTFSTIQKMKYHLNRHTGERPFKCPVCSKAFKGQCDVSVHLRIHTGERPYTCRFCKRSFKQKSHLIQHERLHSGEKPYKCSECSKQFTQQGNLSDHIMLKHSDRDERPYVCQYCNERFIHAAYLRSHLPRHTGEKLFMCKICNMGYKYKSSLLQHTTKVHEAVRSDDRRNVTKIVTK